MGTPSVESSGLLVIVPQLGKGPLPGENVLTFDDLLHFGMEVAVELFLSFFIFLGMSPKRGEEVVAPFHDFLFGGSQP